MVSNPSRGTCAFGPFINELQLELRAVLGLKPLSGNVCLRPRHAPGARTFCGRSQTPLGERVPSAGISPQRRCSRPWRSQTPLGERVPSASGRLSRTAAGWRSLKPLSGNVCLRPIRSIANEHARHLASQTPLGERVPSAMPWRTQLSSMRRCLKPLSGNVCLRPQDLGPSVAPTLGVSNPSRGTCAFGHHNTVFVHGHFSMGLKPLSGNVCLRPYYG